jgi:formylglycine-generating enzyme required for sulfatase activity
MYLIRFWVVFVLLVPTPAPAEPFDMFRDCDDCPEMIELPLGEFMMGAADDEFRMITYFTGEGFKFATPEEPFIPENEGPQNEVVVDIRIAMGKNEITFDEWMACVDDGGCGKYLPNNAVGPSGSPEAIERALTDTRFTHTPSEQDIALVMGTPNDLLLNGRYPVIRVSYLDAVAYTRWLNEKLGTDAYRLPTEAEWEYAARAGTTTRFAQGFEPTTEQANISGQVTEFQLQQERPDLRTLGHPVPVDELDAANQWGLRHMSGNVSEITQSCYPTDIETLPAWKTTREWSEQSVEESCDRVRRGGAYLGGMFNARVAWRLAVDETLGLQSIGFRVVKEIK